MHILFIDLEWAYSPLWLIACALIGVLAAFHLYYRAKNFEEAKPWQKGVMALLRCLTVASLLALLMNPVIKLLSDRTEQKHVVFIQDNSASLAVIHDTNRLKAFDLEAQSLLADISDNAKTSHFYFDESLSKSRVSQFQGHTTNLSNAIEQVKEQYATDRLGAIILATDGIYNEGQNPAYLKSLERTPIFVVSMGDSTAGADIEIQRVFHNRVVFKGDEFEIELDVGASDMKGQSSEVRLVRTNQGQSNQIASQLLRIDKNDFFKTYKFKAKANQPGVIRYRVQVPVLGKEDNSRNNYIDFFVEVIESRQKILLLAHAPHPDLNALKNGLENLKNFEVTIAYPDKLIKPLREYDLVVLHNLPSNKYGLNSQLKELSKLKIPSLFIIGSKTDIRAFNRLTKGLSIQQAQNQFADAEPSHQLDFNLFSVTNEIRQFSSQLPPLRVPFGSYTLSPNLETLFEQEIKGITTNYPLIAMGDSDDSKFGVITGEGIWKWRLYDYAQNASFERSEALFAKIAQYLAVPNDKRRFKVNHDRSIYNENNRVYMYAEFYNASYELSNAGDVEYVLKNENNEESIFAFSKTSNAYILDLGKLTPGAYRYSAATQDGGKRYTAAGQFTVRPLVAELQHIKADHQLLENIASTSGGKIFTMNQLPELKQELMHSNHIKPLYLSDVERSSFLNIKWLLLILLISLSLEWFMRKYLGSY